MNGVQDQYIRAAGITVDDLNEATLTDILGLTTTAGGHGGAAVRRGKSIIPGAETVAAAGYTLFPTPDRVQNLVLPTDGLIIIGFKALWRNSVANSGRLGIGIGTNQLKVAQANAAPVVQEVGGTGMDATSWAGVSTGPVGLISSGGAGAGASSDVATGQSLAASDAVLPASGLCVVFATAGTYDVTISGKVVAGGTVELTERKLWVWTVGF
jgi:hypothetical protein